MVGLASAPQPKPREDAHRDGQPLHRRRGPPEDRRAARHRRRPGTSRPAVADREPGAVDVRRRGGLALGWSLLRALAAVESSIGPIPITLEFALDARAFLFTAALATGAGVLAGLVPALNSTRPNLVRDLNGAVAVARAGGRR